MATTAMFLLKPFKTAASITSSLTGFNSNYNKLAFLHTASLHSHNDYKVIRYIKDIKNNNTNTILLHAGQDIPDETGSLTYDASFKGVNDIPEITGEYQIINKGSLRTGVISAKPGENNVIQKINRLSAYLKKEKNCNVVVCLSQLGFKNKNTTDDITLAEQSTHLDIIISGHAQNFQKNPYIALNSNKGEVIIHSAAGDTTAFGKIEIDFNEYGQKKHISFINTLSDTTTNQAIPAA